MSKEGNRTGHFLHAPLLSLTLETLSRNVRLLFPVTWDVQGTGVLQRSHLVREHRGLDSASPGARTTTEETSGFRQIAIYVSTSMLGECFYLFI